MYTSLRCSPISPSSVVRSCPAAPTKGSPCLSSWKPGASPTNMRSAFGLPEPNTTWVRPCARRQRVQPAVASAYAWSSSSWSTGTALTGEEFTAPFGRASAADGDDPRPPGAARRLDLDLVTDALAQHGAADGRLGRDAADARDVEAHQLAVVPLQLDVGADGDDAARRGRLLVDHLGVVQARAQD